MLYFIDEIEQERDRRYERSKRDELRDALIAFLRSNTSLGESMERAAGRIANTLEFGADVLALSMEAQAVPTQQLVEILREIADQRSAP